MSEWLQSLLDPESLVIETIYNLTFELIATYIFVRFALKKIVRNIIKENDAKRKTEEIHPPARFRDIANGE